MARASVERAARTPRADIADTRLALIDTAERLFSEQGLQRTSLRQINQEAGQRNGSAIHYHFGSRDAVIAAIVELRTRPINEARLRRLAKARELAAGAPLSSAALAEVLVLPLAESISANPGGNHYLRFAMQLWFDRESRLRVLHGPHDTALTQCLDEFARSKPFYPRQVQHQRFIAATSLMFRMLAILEEVMQAKVGKGIEAESRIRIGNVVDMLVGIFDAPITSPAILELASPRKAPISIVNQ